ncbi:cytochrome c family protein [Dongia soli]|uniref:Cytochrome c family protein n=1 Tax=Dongia soli TaxID=600628 RepID=A0ABU5E736_9PROT|nr:cytochrome c family protein [Dongia soli]MDY0881692.1 cytochrome c family protein [Dongia soli]
MSSLEMNKIAAAILVGGILTLGVGIVSNAIYNPERRAHEGAGGEEGGAAPAPAAAPVAVEPISKLLASADPAKGEAIAKKCMTCHTFEKGGPNKVGPDLWGVIGRQAGSHEGFAYSDAIKAVGKPWTYEMINHFIANPKQYAPGTKMTFPGLPKAEDRANVIAFIRTKADSPAPLPSDADIQAAEDQYKKDQEAAAKPAAEAPKPEANAAAPATGGGEASGFQPSLSMIAAADPAKGEAISKKCLTCHTFAKGGPNKIGPDLWSVIGRQAGSHEGFAYSDAIKKLGKPWDFESLDHFIYSPKDFAPGTKMTFAGLKKPEERAALLRWLRDQNDNPPELPK